MTKEEEYAIRRDEAGKWIRDLKEYRRNVVDAVGKFLSEIDYQGQLRAIWDENALIAEAREAGRAEAREKALEEAYMKNYREGYEEGYRLEGIEIARRLRNLGCDDATIMEIMQMTPEDLKEL